MFISWSLCVGPLCVGPSKAPGRSLGPSHLCEVCANPQPSLRRSLRRGEASHTSTTTTMFTTTTTATTTTRTTTTTTATATATATAPATTTHSHHASTNKHHAHPTVHQQTAVSWLHGGGRGEQEGVPSQCTLQSSLGLLSMSLYSVLDAFVYFLMISLENIAKVMCTWIWVVGEETERERESFPLTHQRSLPHKEVLIIQGYRFGIASCKGNLKPRTEFQSFRLTRL